MKFGNLCIAAHNYKNSTFFSDISKLKNGDVITITDINNNSLKYEVYNVYTANQNDLSCISQDTNNLRLLTLITCDKLNDSFRTIVKAMEIN